MAEETTKVEPPTTVTAAPPAWDVNLQNVVKALMQSQKTGTAAGTSEGANPYLLDTAAASPQEILNRMFDQSNLPAATAHAQNVASGAVKGTPPETTDTDLKLLGQLPVQALLQMGQHQVNPQVDAATQRILNALMHVHAGGIVPQPPVAKG